MKLMKSGTRVKMSASIKRRLIANGSHEHVKEFGRCIGEVIGQVDYNNCAPDDANYDITKVGPDVDVRWSPSNLKYGYHPDDLVEV